MTLKALATLAGLLCLAIPLVANPISLPALLGLKATLPVALGILLGVIDLTLAVFGVLLLKHRSSRALQLGVLLGILTTGACLLCGEGVLRLADIQPGVLRLYRRAPGPNGSFRIKPNLDIVTRIDNSKISIRTNSHGMRWREVDVRKRPGQTRVAFVGDSFTFGQWSETAESSMVGVFDARVKSLGLEVLNFGVPGFGFADIEDQLETDVRPFQPDHVVLLSFNGNDFLDTYLGVKRYHVLGNGRLRIDDGNTAQKIPVQFLNKQWRLRAKLEESYVYSLVQYAAKSMFAPRADAGFPPRRPRFETTSFVTNIFWNRTDYPPFAARARDLSIQSLDRILKTCQHIGARLAIVTIPTLEQIYFVDGFPASYDVKRPQNHVEEFATAHGIAYLDLLPPLSEHARRTGANLHFQQEGHFNDEGHRVAGELVADFFMRVVDRGSGQD
jgi:lysophospholipase L1-like esterase